MRNILIPTFLTFEYFYISIETIFNISNNEKNITITNIKIKILQLLKLILH